MISLDTNILVYAADTGAGNRHIAAKELVRAVAATDGALTEQSLLEFLDAATRKAKLSRPEAMTIVRRLLDTFALLVPSATIVRDVLSFVERHKLGVWDARILAVCAAYGCEYLLSEDMQDGACYSGVTVIDPFKAANAAIVKQVLRT